MDVLKRRPQSNKAYHIFLKERPIFLIFDMSEAQKATLGCLLYSYNSHFVLLAGYKHWTITLSEIKS